MDARMVAPNAIARTERTDPGLPVKSGGSVWCAGLAATAAFGVDALRVVSGHTDIAGAVLIGAVLAASLLQAFAVCNSGVAVALRRLADGASGAANSSDMTGREPRRIEDGPASLW